MIHDDLAAAVFRDPPHFAVGLACRTHYREWGWWDWFLTVAAAELPRAADGIRRLTARRAYLANANRYARHLCN